MATDYYVRRSKTDPNEWIVWGPMGDQPGGSREFVGKLSGHSTGREASSRALALNLQRDRSADLTLLCPVCDRRADICFSHGDDWKKRKAS